MPKAKKPIRQCRPWTPEERKATGERLVQILRRPLCYGKALDDEQDRGSRLGAPKVPEP
jgi:hypothetical protein